jgi:hypothetical protein
MLLKSSEKIDVIVNIAGVMPLSEPTSIARAIAFAIEQPIRCSD